MDSKKIKDKKHNQQHPLSTKVENHVIRREKKEHLVTTEEMEKKSWKVRPRDMAQWLHKITWQKDWFEGNKRESAVVGHDRKYYKAMPMMIRLKVNTDNTALKWIDFVNWGSSLTFVSVQKFKIERLNNFLTFNVNFFFILDGHALV